MSQESINENNQKEAFLKKFNLQKTSYQEALEIVGKDRLFDPFSQYGYNDEYDNDDEIDVFENRINIYYSDKDVIVDGDIVYGLWDAKNDLYLVKGNLSVYGEMQAFYYVTGNANFDVLEMNQYQYCQGVETVKYLQYQFAEDDGITRYSRKRHISAPYYFSWFYSLEPNTFDKNTVIFSLYDWDTQKNFKPKNPYFYWQRYYYVFKSDLVYTYNEDVYNGYDYSPREIAKFLKEGKSIFIEGFDINCMSYFQKGEDLFAEGDYENAFLNFKKVVELSPNFYLGYEYAGAVLKEAKAYKQALEYYECGISKLPEKVQIPTFGCLEQATLCALILKDDTKAASLVQSAPHFCEKSNYFWRLKGELYLHQNELEEAKNALEKSIEIEKIFTNNWLLGLVYFQTSDTKKADEYFKVSKLYNDAARPYREHQNLDYFYEKPQSVDWGNRSLETQKNIEKGQEYWTDFFDKKKLVIEAEGFEDVLKRIPQEFRTKDMLDCALDFESYGERSVSGSIISLFKHIPLDKETILNASIRVWRCQLSDIPVELLDRDIYLHHDNIYINEIPKEYVDYELCLHKVLRSYYNFFDLPNEYKDEKMIVTAIASGILNSYENHKIPNKYKENTYFLQALDIDIKAIENIPAKYFEKEVFDYAKNKYGETDYWKEQEANHHPKNVEFNYETFDKVWAYHWTEDFIIKALTFKGEAERIYDLPKKYITQKVADVAVAKNSYDFQFVPAEFITQEMCEIACHRDYGSALEYVPIAMRTLKVCQNAIACGFKNFKFVPLELRTTELCVLALMNDTRQLEAVPYEQYVAVFSELLEKHKNNFSEDFLLLYRGIGYFFEEKYDLAIADFQASTDIEDSSSIQKSLYYEGFAHFKKGELETAQKIFRVALRCSTCDNDLVDRYDIAKLPKIAIAVWTFDKQTFDTLMYEATSLSSEHFDAEALDSVLKAEEILEKSQCSDMTLWASVWDYKRYALYELGRKKECYEVCRKGVEILSKESLWAYLEEHNSIRAALRNMYHSLAYQIFETATSLNEIEEGLEHMKKVFSTISPIEEKDCLNCFYETKAELLNKAQQFDKSYEKAFEKVLAEIKKKKLVAKDILSKEFIEKFNLS